VADDGDWRARAAPPVTLSREAVGAVGSTRLHRHTVELPGVRGARRRKVVGVVERPDAVAVVVLRRSPDGADVETLLVRQPRPAVGDPALIELVAGKVEDGETDPVAVGRRELAEEAGLAADHWTVLAERLLASPGYSTEAITLLAAWGTSEVPSRPEDAHISGCWVPLSDALAEVGGRIRDMKTVVALQLVAADRHRLPPSLRHAHRRSP